ncbi:MAG: 2-oxoacid:acceptor oxidoreductase family protein [Chloroflexota bacterium]
MSRQEIRLSGFGGQGIVLAGQIIGQAAAIYDKGFATLTQSYGPEARGGACSAEVVISRKPVGYPYAVNPQVVVTLSQEAYTKHGRGLPAGTLLIIDPDLVKPDPGQNLTTLAVPATRMAQEMGRSVVANIVMLGFLAATTDLVSSEALQKSIMASVPKGTGEFNVKAFELGLRYGLEHGKRRKDPGG